MGECPELHRGCCTHGYCTAPGHQVEIKGWEDKCVRPQDWSKCPDKGN